MSMVSLKLRDAAERYGDAKLACETTVLPLASSERLELVKAYHQALHDLHSAARAFATSTRQKRKAVA